jgi:indole-3-glycerol phosphate synthase
VSESGIHTPSDVSTVHDMGAHAVLVGESLMREDDIGKKVRELVNIL